MCVILAMTKGNWERRAERANLERQAAKERKLLKKSKLQNNVNNISSIIQQLISGKKYETESANLKGWIEDMTISEWNICRAWLREGDCCNKRCHLSHEITLYGIQNISLGDTTTTTDNNEMTEPSINMCCLQTLPHEKYPLIRFIAVNDVCVFDWARPNIWLEWSQSRLQEISSRKKLQSINEEPNDESDNTSKLYQVDLEIISSITISNDKLSSSCSSPILQLSQSILSNIYQYCSLGDICSLSLCSKDFHNLIRKDSHIRSRRKEYLNSMAKVIHKQKKDEKRKKTKNSHIKKHDKKDGFARGGNS